MADARIERVVVACHNASGDPDFAFVRVQIPEDQYTDAIADGGHYDAAEAWAENQGYEAPMICFDVNDGSFDWLFEHFVWVSATVVDLDGVPTKG